MVTYFVFVTNATLTGVPLAGRRISSFLPIRDHKEEKSCHKEDLGGHPHFRNTGRSNTKTTKKSHQQH